MYRANEGLVQGEAAARLGTRHSAPNLIAITASYFLDLPTGYTVVALYALSGIVFTLVRGVAGPRGHCRRDEVNGVRGRPQVAPYCLLRTQALDDQAQASSDEAEHDEHVKQGGGCGSRCAGSSGCPPR